VGDELVWGMNIMQFCYARLLFGMRCVTIIHNHKTVSFILCMFAMVVCVDSHNTQSNYKHNTTTTYISQNSQKTNNSVEYYRDPLGSALGEGGGNLAKTVTHCQQNPPVVGVKYGRTK